MIQFIKTDSKTCFLLLLLLFIGSQQLLIAQHDNRKAEIKVGVYDNPPKIFMNKEGDPDGIFVDIVKSIAKKEHLDVDFVSGEWNQLMTKLSNGEIDVMPDVAYSKERDSLYTLGTLSVLGSWLEVFTIKSTQVNSISNLEGKKIGVLKGSIQAGYLKDKMYNDFNITCEYVEFKDYSSSVQSLKNMEIDVIVADRFFYFSDLCSDDIRPTGVVLRPTELFFAFTKDKDPDLVKLFDKNLAQLKNDPHSDYYKSIQRWFDREYGTGIPSYFIWLMIVTVFVLIFVTIFALLLRYKVKVKTKILRQKNEELSHASDQIEESEEKHRFLFENMIQGVVYHDANGEINYANQAAANILGLSLTQLLGKTSYDPCWKAVHEDGSDYPGDQHPAMVTLRTNSAVRNEIMGVFNTLRNDYVWINVNSIPKFKGMEEKPNQVIVTFEDITEIRNAKQRVEESDRLKTVFLQNMSHEIRTPMNGILGFLELMKDVNISMEEKNGFLEIINKSGRRLLNTINDIIEISKIESNQVAIHYSQVNVLEILEFHYDFFKPQADEKGLLLKQLSQVPEEINMVVTDRHMLISILTNLISNAIKFTNTGFVEFGNYIDSDTMVFFVKDSGIGIPSDRAEAIFERFVQADLKNTRPYEGSGLGLSIVKAFVDKIHGEIWVESEVNEGSTFFFSIPYKRLNNEPIKVVETEELERITLKNVTILVAEDDEISFLYIRNLLKKTHAVLLHATNGAEAVAYFKENPTISLIIMDIKMPIMNGLEATRQIREINKTIPIIAQTAYAMLGDKALAMEAGCNDYVSKPIEGVKLMQLIDKYTQ